MNNVDEMDATSQRWSVCSLHLSENRQSQLYVSCNSIGINTKYKQLILPDRLVTFNPGVKRCLQIVLG